MAINRTTRRQGVMPSSGELKAARGNHAPMYIKHPQFRSRSMTDENTSSSVCWLKWPSQDIAFPNEDKINRYYERYRSTNRRRRQLIGRHCRSYS